LIDYFFGKPRTGKSYRAIHLIYNEYIKDNKELPKYLNILTNIGGFKFDLVNQIFLDKGYSGSAYKLVWKSFYKHLEKMHSMAMEEKSDEELNRYADYHKINDSLIIIDEASLYFKKYNDVLSWWLAYHGHFRIRIILIAQSPKQINTEYLVHSEILYEAQPQAKQLRSNQLRYIHHSEVPFNKDSKFSSDTITTSKDIYNLYKSGEVDKPKKIIYKYIGIALLGAFGVLFLANLFLNNMKNRVSSDEDVTYTENKTSYNDNIVSSLDDIVLTIRCDDKYCWNVDSSYQNNEITLNYFKSLVIEFEFSLFYEEIKNEIYYLKPFKKTLSKKTLAKFTDYTYSVPSSFKTTFLKDLFIPIKSESKKLILENVNPINNFNDNSNEA